MPKHKVVVARL